MVTYENVLNAPIDKLATAVRDWQAMAAKLEELAEAARNGMKAKADKADWSGVTAGVARPFVDKTAKEFEDAAKEAKGVHQALAQGHDTFRSSRDRLRRIAEEEAPAAGFRVDGKGKVEALPLATDAERHAARHDPDYQESLRVNRPRWQAKVDAAVDACDDVDRSLARLLGANVADGHDFTAPKYAGFTAEQAGRATDLARKGRELSHAELAELNELLADNAAKPEFATAFYGNLGPEGALRFFGTMATDTHPYGRLDEQRLTDVQELQKNLGLNLATATRSTTEPHLPDGYAQELRRLGTQQIPLGRYEQSPPFGYQLLGGIMRYGNYDPRFLVPIADHATQIHAKDPDFFNRGRQPAAGYGRNLLNPSGVNGAGYDPVVSFLEALGHSPAAAADFFDAERPRPAYAQDGSVRSGAPDLGRDATGKRVESYLDFFAQEEYRSTIDAAGTGPEDLRKARAYMPDALGHALEAATLGHAWDDPAPRLDRTEAGARVMTAVALTYGGDAGLLKQQEVLADSLGRMTAGYIDDVNQAVDGKERASVFAPGAGDGQNHADLDREAARDLLAALGQHPDAYATVSTAERVYSASVLEGQAAQGATIDEGRARAVVRTGAEVQGILDESRAEQVRAVGEKEHAAYEKAHERSSHWVEFGTTAAIAAGVAFLPATAAAAGAAAVVVPLAVDTGSGAVEQAASGVIGEWSDETKEKHKDAVDGQTHASNKAMFRAGEYSAEAPMTRFVERHGIDPNGGFGNDLAESVRVGYLSGNSVARQQGHEAQTKEAT
ncbi:hypothetical protein EF910_22220 [Streptomyces sp. WAC07149]|uniref:hypothetical protein n=1 Tax=Streptomyces sp. WAC07149 TaxID=2487425 RepID=UPI000F7BA944|nr:hypothetical protein [Streptomyces sp. WAC07149]RST02994.1 hypothetical protein EF910_22220 [Streptomyces sp. WAC07149]